jgi:hypothetical protein
MSPQISSIATRRQTLVGAASVIITTGISTRASAQFLPWALTWAGKISVGVASGWLVEALKNWGLVPGAKASNASLTYDFHEEDENKKRHEGYNVQLLYRGRSAAGDFAISEARRGDDFEALGTTTHVSTCTLHLDKADAVIVGVVADALQQRGLNSYATEAAGHPIHPRAENLFAYNERYSPNYMTPSGGTIAWKTNLSNPRANGIAAIRCPIISTNVHVAQSDNGGLLYNFGEPVDL